MQELNLFWKAVELKKAEFLIFLTKTDIFPKKCKGKMETQ